MELARFWQLVTAPAQCNDNSYLNERLQALGADEIAEFDALYSKELRALWHWDNWKVAYVIAGCNSEYDFLDFCNWILSRGPEAVAILTAEPDSLAEQFRITYKDTLPYPFIDELDLVAGLLYEQKSDDELPYHSVVNFLPQGKKFKNKPKQLKADLPKLYSQYWLG